MLHDYAKGFKCISLHTRRAWKFKSALLFICLFIVDAVYLLTEEGEKEGKFEKKQRWRFWLIEDGEKSRAHPTSTFCLMVFCFGQRSQCERIRGSGIDFPQKKEKKQTYGPYCTRLNSLSLYLTL